MTLTTAQKKALNLAEDQVKVAAEIMIEKPMEFIKAILFKHETAVIEVMKELHEENHRLTDRIVKLESAIERMRVSGDKFEFAAAFELAKDALHDK